MLEVDRQMLVGQPFAGTLGPLDQRDTITRPCLLDANRGQLPGVLDAVPYRPPGWEFGPLRTGHDRAGFVLARGDSRAEAVERAADAAERIRFVVAP